MNIIENAIPAHLLRAVAADWPDESWKGWHRYHDGNAIKYGTRDAESIPRSVWPCLHAMANAAAPLADRHEAFVDWELSGAGMHMIPPGGHLARHLDSDVMSRTGWRRELSCVLFTNERWEQEWGGLFVLGGSAALPEFNRMIVFGCTDDSWHEVQPVTGPIPRCTLSLFFWSRMPTMGKRVAAEFSGRR